MVQLPEKNVYECLLASTQYTNVTDIAPRQTAALILRSIASHGKNAERQNPKVGTRDGSSRIALRLWEQNLTSSG